MAEDVVVLFVGEEADATQLSLMLAASGDAVRVTRVANWRAFAQVASGWDVIVAGGPAAPTTPVDVQRAIPTGFTTPLLAVVHDPLPVPAPGPVEYFSPNEFTRLVPVLRALRRAALAEDRRRYLEECVNVLEMQARQTGRLRALGQLAAGVAHEFNNILTVIGGFSERLLPAVSKTPELERLVRPIQQAGARGVELSQRLLSFSRAQSPAVGDASLPAAMQEAVAMLRPLLGEKIALHTHLDQTLPRVRGQAGSLIEVIANLALNARDSMPDGGVLALETVYVPEPDGPGTVQLIVRDTGTGMAPDVLSRACEPFFSTKDEGKGTGLGLSLVREIVEQFGGALELRSAPGSGTQAVVTLNAVKAEEIIPEPIVDASTPGGYETILLVEDDASVREIVLEFLRDAAYYVLEARDAAEAQTIMRKEARPVDLLVTDIVLPGMSGPEMAGVLRELSPHMRTLFISGYPSESVGGTRSPSFLAKPFSRAALLQAVRRALNAPRFREIDAPETPGRLVNREPDVAKGTKRNGSH